jgi:predicted GIY-YIG superfamily endonuclease
MSQGNQIFGRIYKIVSSETDDVYIGSTIRTLRERFKEHKERYNSYTMGKKYTTSFEIM